MFHQGYRPVLVQVYSDSESRKCRGWGPRKKRFTGEAPIDIFLKATDELTLQVQKDFGSRVKVEYVDVHRADPKVKSEIQELIKKGHAYPLVFIDGKPYYSGSLLYPKLKEILNSLLQD